MRTPWCRAPCGSGRAPTTPRGGGRRGRRARAAVPRPAGGPRDGRRRPGRRAARALAADRRGAGRRAAGVELRRRPPVPGQPGARSPAAAAAGRPAGAHRARTHRRPARRRRRPARAPSPPCRRPTREVLRLWAWEELAPREIAVVLGTTPNAVSIRLHRAKARLRDELARKDPARAGHLQQRQGRRTPMDADDDLRRRLHDADPVRGNGSGVPQQSPRAHEILERAMRIADQHDPSTTTVPEPCRTPTTPAVAAAGGPHSSPSPPRRSSPSEPERPCRACSPTTRPVPPPRLSPSPRPCRRDVVLHDVRRHGPVRDADGTRGDGDARSTAPPRRSTWSVGTGAVPPTS